MIIEVDQSGKIEQLNFDTMLAFSNEEQYCVKLPRKLKRDLFVKYRKSIKQIRYKLFAVSIFSCIKDHIKLHDDIHIIICCEYLGKENLIKSLLLNLLRKNNISISKKLILCQKPWVKDPWHVIHAIPQMVFDHCQNSTSYFNYKHSSQTSGILKFRKLGKDSNAHIVAIDVFRENRKPNKILKEEDIINLLK